ncbi:uncharacterized protein LOC112598745 isoform X1 [Melanaphis sacchari]|uniref:uncharacterized protein LOC112598745 isoform X1 n=1 Tax=Melanaphis sacchari TaxID=742174 RepID=UPI000DC1429A|nr:uncharacterized protein LOC112598745 isoform X1 [Melanaphis sacchari]
MYSRQNQNQGEARLELLLDDLQSTLPRKNHGLSNTSSTGYREVTKSTSRTIGNGQTETNKEYEIQYLNPANKSTVLSERLPDLQSVDLLRQTNGGKNSGYETVSSYQYNKSTESKSTVPRQETNGVNMRQSISELDSLLDDLNHAQKVGFSNSGISRHEITTNESNIEPLRSSTPYKQQYSKHEEHRYGSLNRSKIPGTSEVISTYETTTTNGEPLDLDLVDTPRSYTKLLQNQSPGTYQTSVYSKETTKKIIPGTTTYSTYQKFGSPTTDPGQSKVYNYSEEYRTDSRNRSMRDLPPSPRPHRSSSPRSPSPHRSPSPMSFPQPPEPRNYSSSHTYTSRTTSPQPVQKFSPSDPSRINEEVTWVAHATPPVTRRFPVSVDNNLTSPSGQTVYSYKYSSETRENTKYGQPNGYTKPVHQEQLPLRYSPFPRDEADTPGLQNPPKRLDDLMASFGDRTDYTNYHSNREYHSNVKDYQSKSREYEHDKAAEYTIPIKKPQPDNQAPENKGPEKLTEVKETEVTQSVAGPPVFYPPGSTTFAKKEEVMQQQGQFGQGQMKAKAKGMYKYKSKSKSKEKQSSGATMVPVCLPMCCAMPCVIM